VHRGQLQHVILEVGHRFDLDDFHIVGSAAILAALPNPPEGALTSTRDVDVIPPQDDERMADRISFVLGEASAFELEHGHYARGGMSSTSRAHGRADSDSAALIASECDRHLTSTESVNCVTAA
jgi:hypothetical protein